jgi:hypothetical protein
MGSGGILVNFTPNRVTRRGLATPMQVDMPSPASIASGVGDGPTSTSPDGARERAAVGSHAARLLAALRAVDSLPVVADVRGELLERARPGTPISALADRKSVV